MYRCYLLGRHCLYILYLHLNTITIILMPRNSFLKGKLKYFCLLNKKKINVSKNVKQHKKK